MIIVALSLLCLSGCNNKNLSIEQSQNNFIVYQNSINKVAIQYGYELKEVFDENIEDQNSYKDLLIIMDSGIKIYIRMINSSYNSNPGEESFNLQYSIDEKSNEKFKINFFVDLINSISGKTITEDFCNEFLQAPESKYPASKYGFKKLNGELIAKQKNLNFFEDWTIDYILSSDNDQILTFGGLTKR